MPFDIAVLETEEPPAYQRIALKAVHLHRLGLSRSRVATALGVTDKTVAKAITWLDRDIDR